MVDLQVCTAKHLKFMPPTCVTTHVDLPLQPYVHVFTIVIVPTLQKNIYCMQLINDTSIYLYFNTVPGNVVSIIVTTNCK